jgi:hypothetical protein
VLGEDAAEAHLLGQIRKKQDAGIPAPAPSPSLDLNAAVEIRLEGAPSNSPHSVF